MSTLETMAEVQEQTGTPFVSVRRGRGTDAEASAEFQEEAYRTGVAVYPSVPRASRAIATIIEWRRRREGLPPII